MSLLRPLLIGCISGMRSMSPLAVVSAFRRRPGAAAPSILDHPAVKLGLAGLALGEAAGDKLPSAPDRIVPLGIAARVVTGGLAGAALAPRGRGASGAVLGAAGAVAAAYVTFHIRQRAMNRFGQFPTGVLEDAITLGASIWIARTVNR